MGIKTSQGGAGAIFYKINQKDGCFQTGSGANRIQYEPGRTTLEGILIGAKVEEDEYEGVKHETLRLILKDTEAGQPNMHVSFTIASDDAPTAFGLRTLAKLNCADFSQPISLNPYKITAGSKLGDITFDSDVTGVSIKQNGTKLVEDMGTPDNKLPERPAIVVNGKPLVLKGREQKDSSPWVPVLDAQLGKLFAGLGTPAESAAEETIDPGEAAAAAAGADRNAMRARA